MTGSAGVKETECMQRAEADNRVSMPICGTTSEIETVIYGVAPRHHTQREAKAYKRIEVQFIHDSDIAWGGTRVHKSITDIM